MSAQPRSRYDGDLSKDLLAFADAAQSRDISAVQSYRQQFRDRTLPSTKTIKQGVDELTAAGYTVSVL